MPETEPAKFKFIHYNNKYGLSYRQQPRTENSRRNKRKLVEQQQRREERQKENEKSREKETREKETGPVSLINCLTSFKRDQFLSYPVRMSPDEYRLESEWFSMFQDVIFLPQLRSTSRMARPQERFFSSALMSGPAYENLVMLPAAGARVEEYGDEQLSLNQDLLRLQAKALHSYRSVLSRVQETKTASRADFEILYAITFAFMDGKHAKEKAYNAMQLSNLFLIVQLRDSLYMHIPIADWIATIMPVPGSTFKRDKKYFEFMKARVDVFLEFAAEAQIYAQAETIAPSPHHRAAFRPGTALRRILTVPLYDTKARQPFPSFFKYCRVRAVNFIYVHLLGYANAAIEARFLDDLEAIAQECFSYESPQASLFLWGLLSYAHENQNLQFSRKDEFLSVPSKFLLQVRGVSLASEMIAWLLQDPNEDGQVKLPLLDFDAIRQSLFGA